MSIVELRASWREQADLQRELAHAAALRDWLAEVIAARAEHDRALAPLQARHEQARSEAEHAHPYHADLQQTAEHAGQRQSEAWREVDQARYHHDNRLARYGSLGYRDDDLQPAIAELDQEIGHGERRLVESTVASTGSAGSRRSRHSPAGWLTGQHERWRADREAAEAVARLARDLVQTRAARAAEGLRHDAFQHEALVLGDGRPWHPAVTRSRRSPTPAPSG